MHPGQIVSSTVIAIVLLSACGTPTAQSPTAPATAVADVVATLQPTEQVAPTIVPPLISTPSASTTDSLTATAQATTQVLQDATSVPTTALAPSTTISGQALVQRAQAALLAQPGLDQQTLTLQTSKAVEWSNSGLGCGNQGHAYLQVITPGFQMTFSDGTRTYEIHTNSTGNPLIWCDNGTPKVIRASQ